MKGIKKMKAEEMLQLFDPRKVAKFYKDSSAGPSDVNEGIIFVYPLDNDNWLVFKTFDWRQETVISIKDSSYVFHLVPLTELANKYHNNLSEKFIDAKPFSVVT
jgi:hypothetical protein